ncbi:MAG: hypothetical protein CFE24_14105 [Flavobacterium sp. BFFFF2]|nr:MAG: hypothetical protein CFE24_14105 [Flavobacterium sp. BFFFF2]
MFILFVSCNENNTGKFLYYSKKDSIVVNDYRLKVTDSFDNIYLLVNDRVLLKKIQCFNVDSVVFISDKRYTAKRAQTSHKFPKGFIYETYNNSKKLFPLYYNSNKEELLFYIGVKNEIQFLPRNYLCDTIY